MGNFHGHDVKCGDIHGKEFLNCSKFHHEFWVTTGRRESSTKRTHDIEKFSHSNLGWQMVKRDQ